MFNEALLKRAESGDVEAALEVANCYYRGIDVEEDNDKAFAWFNRILEMDPQNATALTNIGKYGALISSLEFGRTAKKFISRSPIVFISFIESAASSAIFLIRISFSLHAIMLSRATVEANGALILNRNPEYSFSAGKYIKVVCPPFSGTI